MITAADRSELSIELLEILLADQRLDAFAEYPTGRTALHWTALRGHPSHARLLLQKGLDPNMQDARGKTPLHLATETSNIGAIKMLLCDERTDPNIRDTQSWTPLHKCVLRRGARKTTLDLLLRDDRSNNGMTPFMEAVWRGNREYILALFGCKNFDMADAALENPSQLYDPAHIRLLGDPGEGIRYTNPDASWTAMMYAAAWWQPDVLRVLYDSGRVSIHAKDRRGRTAMDIAAAEGIPMQYYSS